MLNTPNPRLMVACSSWPVCFQSSSCSSIFVTFLGKLEQQSLCHKRAHPLVQPGVSWRHVAVVVDVKVIGVFVAVSPDTHSHPTRLDNGIVLVDVSSPLQVMQQHLTPPLSAPPARCARRGTRRPRAAALTSTPLVWLPGAPRQRWRSARHAASNPRHPPTPRSSCRPSSAVSPEQQLCPACVA